jgi:hypothetical protein
MFFTHDICAEPTKPSRLQIGFGLGKADPPKKKVGRLSAVLSRLGWPRNLRLGPDLYILYYNYNA